MDESQIPKQEAGKSATETTEKPAFEKKLEEMRAENERMERNIAELKELKAIDALSGTGGLRPEMPPVKEETPQEYAKNFQERLKNGNFR